MWQWMLGLRCGSGIRLLNALHLDAQAQAFIVIVCILLSPLIHRFLSITSIGLVHVERHVKMFRHFQSVQKVQSEDAFQRA